MRTKDNGSTPRRQPARLEDVDPAATSRPINVDAHLLKLLPGGIDFIRLPLNRALIEKYNRGRKGREHLPFQGDALIELFEELLDGLNYCDQLEIENRLPQFVPCLRAMLLEASEKVREAYAIERQAHLIRLSKASEAGGR